MIPMMNKPKTKSRMIFCEPCSFKMILQDDNIPDSLVEIKTSAVPGGIPSLDPTTGQIKTKPSSPQKKKIKCPKCGRGVVVKELQGAYSSTIDKIKQKIEKENIEEDRKKRIEDGKPLEKDTNTNF